MRWFMLCLFVLLDFMARLANSWNCTTSDESSPDIPMDPPIAPDASWLALSETESAASVTSDVECAPPLPKRTRGRPYGANKLITKYPRRAKATDSATHALHNFTPASIDSGVIVVAFRAVGTGLEKAIVQHLNEHSAKKPPEHYSLIHDLCLGDERRAFLPRKAEAAILGYKNSTYVAQLTNLLGACVYFASHLYFSRAASELIADIDLGTIVPICLFVYHLSDNTDLNLSMRLDRNKKASDPSPFRSDLQKELCKILQSELFIGFLIEHNGRLEFVVLQVPCDIKVADRSTAEVLRQQINDLLDLPLIGALRQRFPMVLNMTSEDLGGNNVRCENSFIRDFPKSWRIRNFCVAHRFSTVQGYVFKIMNMTMSGIISFGLAQRPSGAHQHLADSLYDSLIAKSKLIIGMRPPDSNSPEVIAQDRLIEFLGRHATRSFRKPQLVLLKHYFKGDPEADEVDLFLPAGLSDSTYTATKERWARESARALLPYATALFARSRWCTSGDTIAGVGLLSLQNNVLADAVPRWMDRLGWKRKKATWTDDADAVEERALVADVAGERNEAFWQAFNNRSKRQAEDMATNIATPMHIVVMLATMNPLIDRFQALLKLGSDQYELDEAAKLIAGLVGSSRSYPLLEFTSGRFLKSYFHEMQNVCFAPGELWYVLATRLRTEQALSLAFAMSARSVAGISFTVAWVYEAYPFRLWLLIDGDLDADSAVGMILSDCRQKWCQFTILFRSKFSTRDDLRSDRCRAVLFCMAYLFRVHMARVENRHALLRRMLLDRGSTWLCEMMSIASDLILQWSRKREKEMWESRARAAQDESESTVTANGVADETEMEQPKLSTPHGGAQRAFASKWLAANKRPHGVTKSEHFHRLAEASKLAMADPAQHAIFLELGAAATMSGRAGGVPFGPRQRRRPNASVSTPSIADVSDLLAGASDQLAVYNFTGVLVLSESLDDLRRSSKNKTRDLKEGIVEKEAKLVAWARKQRPTSADVGGTGSAYFATSTVFGRFSVLVPIPPIAPLSVSNFLPPLSSVAKALSETSPTSLKEWMMSEWLRLHRRLSHNEVPNLGKVPQQEVSICEIARVCCCNEVLLPLFVDALQKCFKLATKPKTLLRSLFDTGALVLRFDSGGEGLLWLHASHVNFNTFRGSFVKLSTETDEFRVSYAERVGLRALKAPNVSGMDPMTWHQACFDMPFEQPISLAFEQLSAREVVVPFDFLPGHVLTMSVLSIEPICFWSGPPVDAPIQKEARARRPTGLPPLNRLAIMDANADNDDADADPEDELDIPPTSLPGCGAALDIAEATGWCDSSDGEPDDDPLFRLPGDAWGIPPSPPSDGGHVDPGPGDLGGPPFVDDIGGQKGFVSDEPPPLPPLAPLAKAKAKAMFRGRWRVLHFEGFGKIEFVSKEEINAHCMCADHLGKAKSCKMDKKATGHDSKHRRGQGRPAALSLVWLRDGPNHTGPDAKQKHADSKKQLASALNYPLRVAARLELIEMAETDVGIKDLLDAEREPYSDEDLEPVEIPM